MRWSALEETRAQIAEHRRFRDLTRRLVEAGEALCRARLAAGRDAGRNAQERGLRGSLSESFPADLAAEIDTLAGPGPADAINFEALESAARYALGLAGGRAKAVTTVLGPMRLARAYHHCPDCGTGFHPRDRALGIESASLSPGVVRMTGLAAARGSFAETGALLHDLAGVNVDAKQAARPARSRGSCRSCGVEPTGDCVHRTRGASDKRCIGQEVHRTRGASDKRCFGPSLSGWINHAR